MVATQPSNKSKHPGKVDLPARSRRDAKLDCDESDDNDDDDNDDDGNDDDEEKQARIKKPKPRNKPGPMSRKAKQAKKAAATDAVAQLELEMAETDAREAKEANRPPISKVTKKPQTVSSNRQPKTFRPKDIRT